MRRRYHVSILVTCVVTSSKQHTKTYCLNLLPGLGEEKTLELPLDGLGGFVVNP